MSNFIKKMIKKTFKSMYAVLKGSYLSLRTLCAGNRDTFRSKSGKDVLFCGNGPSLSRIDLKKARKNGMDIACVNFFPSKNKDFFKVKPDYLFLLDPAFFNYSEMHCQTDQESLQIKELYDVLKKVDWNLEVVVRQGAKLPIKNDCLKVTAISKYSYSGEGATPFLDFLYRHDLLIPGAQNVSIAAVFFLLNRTAGTIYLSGVDMSEFKCLVVDENNEVFVETVHNYGTSRIPTQGLIKKGELYRLLGLYQLMFEQFYYLSRYARRLKRTVINLAPESCLDVFDKKILKELETDESC